MDYFHQQPTFHNSSSQDFREKNNTERAQVTMIYEGKVFVFSDLNAEKAEQILQLAEDNGTSPQIYTQTSQLNSSPSIPNFVKTTKEDRKFDISMDDMTCALPIARRNSLHRFLEKRRDRYVGHEVAFHLAGLGSEPQDRNKWWLGLGSHP